LLESYQIWNYRKYRMELSQFMGHAGKNHGLSEIIIQKMAYNGPKNARDSIKHQMQ